MMKTLFRRGVVVVFSHVLVGQSVAWQRPVATLPGFHVERVTPETNRDSYIVLTFDSLERPVVSKERDYPRILIDGNRDGTYETEKIFTREVSNCQGLWFDGRAVYGICSPLAPGQASRVGGLYRLEDTNGDDYADTFQEISLIPGEGIGEHGPHAIRRGPDGAATIIIGNNSFVPDASIDPLSPLRGDKEAQLLPALRDGRGFPNSARAGYHGTLVRVEPASGRFTLLYGGLRNAYDHAYNLAGEAFTFDSDMEWDINLPWYRAVRSVHMVPGGNGGYRDGSGKYPDYYLDSLPPLREVGRGSPVGVEFYHSYVYPEEFFDGYFEADWSRGRLLFTRLNRRGASYEAGHTVEFVQGARFITDIEVGPDGMLYFTTGGRNNDGGLYRVRWVGRPAAPADRRGVLAVVRQPQPLSSWGWEAIERAKHALGDFLAVALERLARNRFASGEDRARAAYELHRHWPPVRPELLRELANDDQAQVRAAGVYLAGLQTGAAAAAVAAFGLKDRDPIVRRRAAEALVRQGMSADRPPPAPVWDIYNLLNDRDRFVRYAGRLALERTPAGEWKDRVLNETNPLGAMEGLLALARRATSSGELEPVLARLLAILRGGGLGPEHELRLLRAFQYAAAEAGGGVPAGLLRQAHDLLAPRFPAEDERLSRELARTLAYCGQPEAIGMILAALPAGEENQPLQIDYVYSLRAIRQGWTRQQKEQLTGWFAKAAQWRGGASFAGYLKLMFGESLSVFDPDERQTAYKKVPQFAP